MANIAMGSMEVLNANLDIIRDFKPMDAGKMEDLRLALQPFYQGHRLAWMQPGYRDGWSSGIHMA